MSTTVTAESPSGTETRVIENNYCIVTDGEAYVDGIQVHRKGDGTVTFVVTIKDCRP